jgi:hypothetical protein
MQLMYCYDCTNSVYSMAFYMNIIFLNLTSCKVHHTQSGALGQRVANIPSVLSLTTPEDIQQKLRGDH